VLETSGTLAWLDTTSTAGPDTLTETAISVPGAVRLVYDGNANRIYVPGGSEVVIVDASQSAPSTIATIPITAFPPASRGATDPCAATATATLSTVDVSVLPDGSRAYAGSYYEAAVGGINYICPQVTVIDAVSSTMRSSIAIPGFAAFDSFCGTTRFRVMMAAGGDSSRAYLASCDGGNVNVIDTSNDNYILNLLAPPGTRQTVPPGPDNLPQNPVFLLAGP
jgi:hypothetical protein